MNLTKISQRITKKSVNCILVVVLASSPIIIGNDSEFSRAYERSSDVQISSSIPFSVINITENKEQCSFFMKICKSNIHKGTDLQKQSHAVKFTSLITCIVESHEYSLYDVTFCFLYLNSCNSSSGYYGHIRYIDNNTELQEMVNSLLLITQVH